MNGYFGNLQPQDIAYLTAPEYLDVGRVTPRSGPPSLGSTPHRLDSMLRTVGTPPYLERLTRRRRSKMSAEAAAAAAEAAQSVEAVVADEEASDGRRSSDSNRTRVISRGESKQEEDAEVVEDEDDEDDIIILMEDDKDKLKKSLPKPEEYESYAYTNIKEKIAEILGTKGDRFNEYTTLPWSTTLKGNKASYELFFNKLLALCREKHKNFFSAIPKVKTVSMYEGWSASALINEIKLSNKAKDFPGYYNLGKGKGKTKEQLQKELKQLYDFAIKNKIIKKKK